MSKTAVIAIRGDSLIVDNEITMVDQKKGRKRGNSNLPCKIEEALEGKNGTKITR